MNYKLKLLALLLVLSSLVSAQGVLPLVYEVENTGVGCPPPPLPAPGLLPNIPMLPDPFAWSDDRGRITSFAEWACRRNEIRAEIEHYQIGPKPPRPQLVTASLSGTTLTVEITENGQTLVLTSTVTIPQGTGPFPVVIGMGTGTGSLPADLFQGVIRIPFMFNQVATNSHQGVRDNNSPYFRLYPHLTHVGYYSAWSWGVSRLIDGIEIVQAQLSADTKRIAVTGCSFAGKMALYAGAFDERVALTIAHESGGGGVNSWRVAETLGNVERISNTNYSWFMQSLHTNFNGRVATLPYDHHELMAMIAPRALLVLGNPPWTWLGDEAGYVASRAVEEVYKAFGIPYRFGFIFRPAPNHCTLPEASLPVVQAFINRFLFGNTTANTQVRLHDFPNVDYQRWMREWMLPLDPNTPLNCTY